MRDLLEILTAALFVACAVWLVRRHRARVAAAAESRARQEEQRFRRLAQQRRVRERLMRINEESLSLLESMPAWVEAAESQLDRAELDFSEGAFAPFWDSVERAALSLAGFDESVRKLESNSCEYIELLAHHKGHAPAFAVSVSSTTRMKLATATSHRMHGIVRRAQRDFQFSVIYEHRKTNQILVAGFRHLAQAVEEMASQITASIDRLTTSVDKMAEKLEESLRRVPQESARQEKALQILDRIEGKRYPSQIQSLSA